MGQPLNFRDRFGQLTVEEVLELNRIAKETCEGDG